jgi:hypothetical protein
MRLPFQLLVMAIFVASACANICPTLAAQKEDPFDYAKRLIDSLGWADSASLRLPSDESGKPAEQQADGEFIKSMSDHILGQCK